MRFLLLLLSLVLQLNVSGFANHSPQEIHAIKTLNSENSGINGRSDWLFRFQGQYEDSETGLYYNRFRYYDPDTGNYISQDPIRLNVVLNIYAYVHDPNSWVDIFGLIELYRAVFGAEHADIVNNNVEGQYETGKLFATSYDDAVKIENLLQPFKNTS